MRFTMLALCALGTATPTMVPVAAGAPPARVEYRLVPAKRSLGAGESAELRIVPPPPEGARVGFQLASGATAAGLVLGVYRAPYVIPSGTPPVRVTASISGDGVRASASAEIELVAGSVAGSEDCLGPGQSYSDRAAGIEPSHIAVDELPSLLLQVAPEYPRSAFARSVEDTIVIHALVCRSGRVLDAFAPPVYRSLPAGMEPIEQDPKLVEAALAAVRRYVFSPARAGGQGVATWIATPVAFQR